MVESEFKAEIATELVISKMRKRALSYRLQAYAIIIGTIIASYFTIQGFTFGGTGTIFINGNTSNTTIEMAVNLGDNPLIPLIERLVLRFGAVLVALYLIQLLFSVARYRLRVAEDISSRADTIQLSLGDLERLKALAAIASPIEFGNLPQHSFANILETVKELAAKIPAR